MPEEETGLQTEENTEQNADSQTDTGTTEKTETKDEIDWKQRHKDLQADYTRKAQRVAELEQQAEQSLEEPEVEYLEDEGFVDKKTVGSMIKQAVAKAIQGVRMQSADSYFRRSYPELVKHENVISGILRNPKNPEKLQGASSEERIDAAVKEFKKLTEEAVTEAKTEAEAEAKKREEKNRKAAGLGASTTAPAKSEDEDLSDAEEIRQRKVRLAKRRSLA